MDYFDDSLFDIGFPDSPKTRDSIPVTLGSISSQASGSQRGSICNDMLEQPATLVESPYMNIDKLQKTSKFYYERSEGHYARLSDLKSKQPQNTSVAKPSLENRLSFYEQKAVEQRARSRSRGREERRGRSRSARSSSQPGGRSCSRGRSASRDIMALYTSNRPLSTGRLPSTSTTDERAFRRNLPQNSSSSSRPMYLPLSKRTTSETQSSRPTRRSDSPRLRHSKSRSSTPACDQQENQNTMTILEMDVERNYQIERVLLAANSVKPANIQMMMVASHAPENNWSTKDETTVRAGQLVTALYKQNEWLYVATDEKSRGFVPYAYAKPVKPANGAIPKQPDRKTSSRNFQRKSPLPTSAKPVTGILKTSQSKQKQRRSMPKYSVKVRTAADNDSLSSETSSVIMEDFVYTRIRPFNRNSDSHADCIVIDTDEVATNISAPNHSEETGTYSSDSGFSDPHSNHSEDSDLLHSPASFSCDISKDSGISIPISTSRLPKERIVSVTTQLLETKPSKPENASQELTSPKGRYTASPTISDMPLGPLGARLAKLALEKKESAKLAKETKIGSDMRDRARCSSTTPASMRPEIPKDYNGPRVTVVFDYSLENEDDLEVKASDIVTVLNSEDIEWIWVQRRDGKEGFIPRDYVIPLELSLQNNRRRVGVSLL